MSSSQIIVLITGKQTFQISSIPLTLTGGNTGLGFETAKNLLLSSPSYHIIIGSRNPSNGNAAVTTLQSLSIKGTVSSIELDVTKDASVDAAAHQISETYGRLDVLVNNAGIFSNNPVQRDAFREVLAVNLVGVISITETFLPLLKKSSSPRLIFVSSSGASITHAADPSSRYYKPSAASSYRASKAALSMVLVQYHGLLKEEGFKVHGADPGLNATDLTGDRQALIERGARDPSFGGETIASVVRGDRDADVGRLCGEYGVSPW
jgi:NAD(P)-dependent dehydrogenase (short-subunit alcohol dehydrogenase family)